VCAHKIDIGPFNGWIGPGLQYYEIKIGSLISVVPVLGLICENIIYTTGNCKYMYITCIYSFHPKRMKGSMM
jgi:hypothetical protein